MARSAIKALKEYDKVRVNGTAKVEQVTVNRTTQTSIFRKVRLRDHASSIQGVRPTKTRRRS